MIGFKTGDIFAEDAEALVNTVNCVGVMGRGIALQFKKTFPENFKAYAAACKKKEVLPGQMFVYETGTLTNPRFIINFPTKRHWRGKSRIEDIDSGLISLREVIRTHGIRSIAIPPLGSGLGGLNWAEVRPRIEQALTQIEGLEVVIFEPGGGPTDGRANRSTNVPKMTPGRAALIELMNRYLRGLLDPFVTLLEVHKLMYFMQVAEEPLRLNFKKGLYGPYAENLRFVLNAIEGHWVSGYADGGDAPQKQLTLIPGALEEAQAVLKEKAATRERFERVSDLVDGFESSFGLELLATVHWIVTGEEPQSFEELIEKTYAWNSRKKRLFSQRQIELAAQVLSNKGWIEPLPRIPAT